MRPTCGTRPAPRAGTVARGRGPARTTCSRPPPRRDGPGGRPAGAESGTPKPLTPTRPRRRDISESHSSANLWMSGSGSCDSTRLIASANPGIGTSGRSRDDRRKTSRAHFRCAGSRSSRPASQSASGRPWIRTGSSAGADCDRAGTAMPAAAIIKAAAVMKLGRRSMKRIPPKSEAPRILPSLPKIVLRRAALSQAGDWSGKTLRICAKFFSGGRDGTPSGRGPALRIARRGLQIAGMRPGAPSATAPSSALRAPSPRRGEGTVDASAGRETHGGR